MIASAMIAITAVGWFLSGYVAAAGTRARFVATFPALYSLDRAREMFGVVFSDDELEREVNDAWARLRRTANVMWMCGPMGFLVAAVMSKFFADGFIWKRPDV